ncbi:cis-prenyltransferase [Coemansia sp. RSA 2675]|uniref:Cis-prenyltransferase n=1 Tax=Coemansia linderi TaxID=2663919 RepID=A0ACC1KCM2_9FUNG|nr:cis-prenyltransferase [Coemansia sp. RSA 2675]KAJ2784592.1 cis-prenyltransferase [Coemansia linderi]
MFPSYLQSWYAYAGLTALILAYIVVGGVYGQQWPLPLSKQCQAICTYAQGKLRLLAVHVLRQGPIPQHVGFIMDGNRRFAKKAHMETPSSGHMAGFSKLTKVLEWCNDLGIKHVSVFAFAINNFNRSTEEVGALMGMARDKLRDLAENSELVNKYGVRIRVVGFRDLLPADVRESIEYAEEKTKGNLGMTLNVCCPYSATDEISTALRRVVEDVENGLLEAADINEKELERRLQIPGPDLDILVRTSGQIRFSNFMLWQSAKMAYIQFVDAYWPEFSFYHMARILVSWQLASRDIERRKLAGAVHDSLAASEQSRNSVSSSDTCCGDRAF